MSYAKMLGWPAAGEPVVLHDYRNGFHGAALVWDAFTKAYLPPGSVWLMEMFHVCALDDDARLTPQQRVLLQITFDGAMIPRDDALAVADAIEQACEQIGVRDHCHAFAWARDLRALPDGIVTVGFVHTTSNGDRWYDLARDTGHWFVEMNRGVE